MSSLERDDAGVEVDSAETDFVGDRGRMRDTRMVVGVGVEVMGAGVGAGVGVVVVSLWVGELGALCGLAVMGVVEV